MTSEIKFEDFLTAQLKDMEDFMEFSNEITLTSEGTIPSRGKKYKATLIIELTEEQ